MKKLRCSVRGQIVHNGKNGDWKADVSSVLRHREWEKMTLYPKLPPFFILSKHAQDITCTVSGVDFAMLDLIYSL